MSTATPRYPQTNEQAESSNKSIIKVIKRCLKAAKGKWADELPSNTAQFLHNKDTHLEKPKTEDQEYSVGSSIYLFIATDNHMAST